MRTRVSILIFVMSFVAPAIHAQDFWEKKPASSWSEKEAKRLLEDSPWTNRFSLGGVSILETSRSGDTFDRDTVKEMWYRAQFWSARPMREARVRTMQAQSKYDQMKPADQKIFDERAKGFIEVPFPETIVVRVTYGASVVDWDRKMARYWSGQTPEMQKSRVFLVADGKRLPLLDFQQSPGGANEFYLTFPRAMNGEPVLTATGKMGIEFQHPDVGSAPSSGGTSGLGLPPGQTNQTPTTDQLGGGKTQRVWIEFKPSKMMYHGQMAY